MLNKLIWVTPLTGIWPALLTLVLTIVSTRTCKGADSTYAVRPVTVDDGLSQSHVTTVVQDRQGFIWIGTAVGLNRHDGRDFVIYTHRDEDPSSVSGNAIYALHVDPKGQVWAGTDRGLDRYDPTTDSFKHYAHLLNVPGRRSPHPRSLDTDAHGNLWVAVRADIPAVVKVDTTTGLGRQIPLPAWSAGEIVYLKVIDDNRVMVVLRDMAGRSFEHGFAVLVIQTNTGNISLLTKVTENSTESFGTGERAITVAPAGPDSFWIGAPGNRVFQLNVNSGEMSAVFYDRNVKDSRNDGLVSHVVAGRDGSMWVLPTWSIPGGHAGANKIYKVSKDGRSIRQSSLRPRGVCDLTRSLVIASTIDQTGVLWAGLSGAGMCVSDLESGMFPHIHESSADISLSNNFVRSVWKSPDGIVWVGGRSGLNRIDREQSKVKRYRHLPGVRGSLADDEVTSILVARDQTLWVGTKQGGLNRSIRQDGTFEAFVHDGQNPDSIRANHVTSLLEDKQGTLWVGTHGGGLNRYNPSRGTFTAFRHSNQDPATLSSDRVTALLEDSTGEMWVGTEDAGLNRFDRTSGTFKPVELGLAGPTNIVSMTEDPATPGIVWIATILRGVIRYDGHTSQVKWYSTNNSLLPSDTVFVVVADDSGAIWAGTNRGLARIDVRSELFCTFGTDQGLQSMEFNTRAGHRSPDGELFLGGVGGLNAFYPKEITQNSFPARVVITQIRTLNRSDSGSRDPWRLVYRNDGSPRKGEFAAGARDFIINYSALHFSDPSRNSFRYKMEGYDNEWRDAGTARNVTYTNLPFGTYKFRLRAVTSRGVWTEQEADYTFTIAKPFYRNTAFILLMLSVIISAIFAVHRFRLRTLEAARKALEEQVAQRTAELTRALSVIGEQTEELRESAALKTRFITNVSHDFRTPLTVSLGTLSSIQSGAYGQVSDVVVNELKAVVRSEKKLLRLVDQLMIIARLDSGKLRLHVVECDLASITRDLVWTFGSVARDRQILLRCDCEGTVLVYCDPEWMEQTIANLLLNALKFSPEGSEVVVDVRVDASAGKVCVSVADQGPGISPEEIPRIFDRFYQTASGAMSSSTGIGVGLSLAREIVDLHSGEIVVSSEPGAGTVFRVLLRTGHAHFGPELMAAPEQHRSAGSHAYTVVEELPGTPAASEEEAPRSADRPAVLVVDDDPELQTFLVKNLQKMYRVRAVSSAEEALAVARTELPDIVVSDVMMNGMSGTELCKELRSSPDTDFIPVLLLSAKAQVDDRIVGLDTGADDYLTKPFELAELRTRIRNILHSRLRLHTRFNSQLALSAARSLDGIPDSADDVFIRRMYDVIRENAHDADFSVEQLAEHLALSRMHLYRQLRRILDKSPADVLMEYRLERAAELLAARTGPVSEVAYGIGFRNLSHFTRRFREKFGRTPSEYRNRPVGKSALA